MNILITGGAGFIGSHIADALIQKNDVGFIRVLDNLSTGFKANIQHLLENASFQWIEGDITDPSVCETAMQNVDVVCHQAALGSVPRSIKTPMVTFQNNINGFINVLEAARLAGVKKMVYASSSSVYGDANYHPKVEGKIGNVLSPYAASKHTNEIIAEAYAKNYGMQIAGFRYFNVFGPRQDPDGPYAAVIPLFIKHALQNTRPTINGDGSITRDYTYVDNVVKANLNAMFGSGFTGHQVFNIACGKTTTLLELWHKIKLQTDASSDAVLGPERKGDILHSLADVSKASSLIGYTDLVDLDEGLQQTILSYKTQNS
jgi:UDP-N-acetylglucosamine/UDP-N-acetylgalactosamine 4-epimerase